jgi:hypothetical protein
MNRRPITATFLLVLLSVVLTSRVGSGEVVRGQSLVSGPDRTVGAAEVYYFKDRNKTRSQVRIYLLGSAEDTRANKDTVSMDVIFEVEGQKVTKPRVAKIALIVRSVAKSKYTKNHNLHIYTDGIEGMNGSEWRTQLITSAPLAGGGLEEVFLSPPLEYRRIVTMANAREVIVSLGESEFRLKKSDLHALRDLNQTIEE